MWPPLKAHHDTPTPGGLSPDQILFGRDPLGRGLPLSGDGMAMDAKEFFARQKATVRDIRQPLEKEHAERQKSAPSSTAQKFRVGDPVWVIRPRPMGTHRTKTWFTPGEVVRRIGEDTYRIKVGHGQFREGHESQLCVREPDLRGKHVFLDYAAHEADSYDDYAEQDDYTVEKILAQHPNASAPGGLEFKVRWRDYGPSDDTWELVSSFVPRIDTPFMDYIRKHKTKLHVSDSPRSTSTSRGALRTCPSTKHSSPASPHKRWDYGWPSRACTPRTPYTSSSRSHTATHTAMDAQTRRPNTRTPTTPQGSNACDWTPHTTATCSTCP